MKNEKIEEKIIKTIDKWSIGWNVKLYLESRNELLENINHLFQDYKKELLQIVIEDVPHYAQERLLELLIDKKFTGKVDRDNKKIYVGDEIERDTGIFTVILDDDGFHEQCNSGKYAFQNTQYCRKIS